MPERQGWYFDSSLAQPLSPFQQLSSFQELHIQPLSSLQGLHFQLFPHQELGRSSYRDRFALLHVATGERGPFLLFSALFVISNALRSKGGTAGAIFTEKLSPPLNSPKVALWKTMNSVKAGSKQYGCSL